MNIHARKLEFIQNFLKLQSEEILAQFEKLLKNAQNLEAENEFGSFTKEELNQRISKSENDFQNKNFKPTSDLLSKY